MVRISGGIAMSLLLDKSNRRKETKCPISEGMVAEAN